MATSVKKSAKVNASKGDKPPKTPKAAKVAKGEATANGQATAAAIPAPDAPAAPVRKSGDLSARFVTPDPKIARRTATLLKLGADPTRLSVLLLLHSADGQTAENFPNVGDLCKSLGISQPAISHHLALLRHGGIIEPVRTGKFNYYHLSDVGRRLARAVAVLGESC